MSRAFAATMLAVVVLCSTSASAYLPIYGGPTYSPSTGDGYQNPADSPQSGIGVGVGGAEKYVGGVNRGLRAVRWDTQGFVELASLPVGTGWSRATGINSAGTIIGSATQFNTPAGDQRPVRWDAGGTIATELETLTSHAGTSRWGFPIAINSTGIIVGTSDPNQIGNWGPRAVRWDAGGTAVTELGNLGLRSDGAANNRAYAINDLGTIVGQTEKYVSGVLLGDRAARWDANSTIAIELGTLGEGSAGYASGTARDINTAGVIAGYSRKYVNTEDKGQRGVRWLPGNLDPIELGNLGTRSDGFTFAIATEINSAGTCIGGANRYSGDTLRGQRAVRWDAGSTSAIELGNLGTDSNGETTSVATSINDSGIIVGFARLPVSGLVWNALAWMPGTTTPINLNWLIDPNSGWVLNQATEINSTNWVAGLGTFDPDGPGGVSSYERLFLIQIPEPVNAFSLLSIVGVASLRRRRA